MTGPTGTNVADLVFVLAAGAVPDFLPAAGALTYRAPSVPSGPRVPRPGRELATLAAMILHPTTGGPVAIAQSAHAFLAFQIAEHWGNRLTPRPSPRAETLVAVLLHDAGWDGREEPRLSPDGQPVAFDTFPEEERETVWASAVERAGVRGRYVAYLVSHHVSSLAESGSHHRRPDFVAAQQALRGRLRDELAADRRYQAAFATDTDAVNRAVVRLSRRPRRAPRPRDDREHGARRSPPPRRRRAVAPHAGRGAHLPPAPVAAGRPAPRRHRRGACCSRPVASPTRRRCARRGRRRRSCASPGRCSRPARRLTRPRPQCRKVGPVFRGGVRAPQ